MISRATITAKNTLVFGPIALVDDFDELSVRFYRSTGGASSVLYDFQQCTFVDLAVLMNFIAMFRARTLDGHKTFISVPKEKKVRDFFRAWRFPDAFFAATGTRFTDILVSEDQKYRGEPQTTYLGMGGGVDALEYDRDWTAGSATRRNFFELMTFSLGNTITLTQKNPSSIPRDEGGRWNNALIRQVLSHHLDSGDPADDVARVVIYESLSNAVRHPRASVIQTASKFLPPPRVPTAEDENPDSSVVTKRARLGKLALCGYLRLFVWDDGESITETLKPLVSRKQPVRSHTLPTYMYDRIFYQLRDFQKAVVREGVANQAVDPLDDAGDEEILLSSFYPGISRTVAESVDQVDPFDTSHSAVALTNKQGMGLYALMKTVIDTYQGSLFVRCGNLRLTLESSHDAFRVRHNARYKAKITRYPESFPNYTGNLLIVQLPLRDKK
jgi:hypothetical protein